MLQQSRKWFVCNHRSFLNKILECFVYMQNLWLGGYQDSEGKNVSGFDTLKKYLKTSFELVEDKHLPFFIRETFYEGQWIVAHAIIWKRRESSQ